VERQCDEELDDRFLETGLARITIEIFEGRTIGIEPQQCTKSDAQDPFTESALEAKLRRYAGSATPNDRARKIISSI